MGISKKIVGSGIIVLTIICCQFFAALNPDQTIIQRVPVELTGSLG